MTDFPTSISRRAKRRKSGMTGPVFGGVLVFLFAFIFSVSHSFLKVGGTANIAGDLMSGIAVGLAGGLAGALVVWLVLYFALGGRHRPGGLLTLGVLAGIAIVGAVPASGLRVMGDGMAAEQNAIEAIRARSKARSDAHSDKVWDERDALVGVGFVDGPSLARRGGVTRARAKVAGFRVLMARAVVEDERLRMQARAEVEALPVSPGRRTQMLREFDASLNQDRETSKTSVELTEMMMDEVEAMLDVLARSRWVVEYGQIAFFSDPDLNAFRLHSERVNEINAELRTLSSSGG